MSRNLLLPILMLSVFFQSAEGQKDVLFNEKFDDMQLGARGWYDGTSCRINTNSRDGAGCIEYEWIKGIQGV